MPATLTELQSALSAKKAEVKQIADAFEVEGDTIVVSEDQKKALDEATGKMREIRGLIESLREAESEEKWANEPDGDSASRKDAAQAARERHVEALKSLGERFLESDEFKALDNGRNGANSRAWEVKAANIGALWRGGMATKDLYSVPAPAIGGFPGGTTQREPMLPMVQRTQRVRDLFPVQNTTASVIEYFKVMGFVNGASTVAQRTPDNTAFALKPQTTLQFAGEQTPVRTIAHWEAAHRNVLADEPQLRGIIDNELLYGLRLVEDAQILSGSGTGQDLRGILNTPGIQNYLWSAGATTPVPDNKADAIRRAATLAFLAQYQPTGVVLHPNDWEDIELSKDNNGQYLLAVSIALGGEQRVWRMPVVDTPAMPEGTALVGAFGLGATLYDREEANIRVAEQHADFFLRNAVVILAEERLALSVRRPESFVEVSFDGAPA
jgi:HK97 family phage major capsid protein